MAVAGSFRLGGGTASRDGGGGLFGAERDRLNLTKVSVHVAACGGAVAETPYLRRVSITTAINASRVEQTVMAALPSSRL